MGFSGTFLYLISRSQQDSSEIRHCWTRAVLASHKWFDDVNTANSKGNNFLCAIGWYAHVRAWNALESTAEVPILFSKTKRKLHLLEFHHGAAKFYTFGCDAVDLKQSSSTMDSFYRMISEASSERNLQEPKGILPSNKRMVSGISSSFVY